MNKISQFNIRGNELELMTSKNEIGYSMVVDGKPHGLKVTLQSRKTQDIASAVMLLFLNAIDTLNALESDVPKATS